MRRERLKAYIRASVWLAVAALAVLSLVPGEIRPHVLATGRLEHFVAYGLTGSLAAVGYARVSTRLWWWLALTMLAGAFEVIQNFIPGRSPSPFDALASSAGLAVGLLLASWVASERYFGFATLDEADATASTTEHADS